MSLSEIRVNTTKTRTGVGTITYTETGPVITGIATASNFKTGSTNVHSTGVELANINTGGSTATFGGPISGTTASFSGTVSIGGTLTYEDVTNIDSVGIITARNGIYLDKFIYHSGDLNTSFGFPNDATDTFVVNTSSLERLRINSSGAVSICTNNQTSGHSSAKLRVGTESGSTQGTVVFGSADTTTPALTVTNWDGAQTQNWSVIQFDNSGWGNFQIGGTAGADAFAIYDDTVERLRINSSGRVNIGHLNQTGSHLDYTRVNIYGQTVAGGTNKNLNLLNVYNYGSGGVGDITGIGLGAGASPGGYTKASIGFIRTGSYGRGDLTFYINDQGNGNQVVEGDQKLRITSGGHIVTQGLASYSFQNDSANAKIFEVTGDGTVGEYGVINISGNQDTDNTQIGALKFINRQNSNGSSGNNAASKQVAAIQTFIKSDGNAGDDSGGILTFHTKAEAGVNGERVRIDETGRVLIGGTSQVGDGKLIVYSSDKKHPAIKCAGTSNSNANGWTLLGDNYQSDESQVNLGVSYSSSSLVLSRCCKVSDTADNTYLSSQDSFATRPSALVLGSSGELRYHTTETNATTATDSAVSLTEVFQIDRVGNIYQRITNRYMYFGASNQLKVGIVSSDPVIDALSGHLQLKKNGATICTVRDDHLQMYGDIKMNNDKGISFINADDTASGETVSSSVLDDYEEGSFTASLKGHTDPSNTSSTNANKTTTTTGYYVKVGQNVTVTMRWYNLQNNGANEMHNCQLQNIHGLPYNSKSASTNWSASIGYQRGLYPRWSNSTVTSQAVYMYGYIEGNDDKVQLRCSQTSGPGTLYPTVHDSTSHMFMTFTISYQTYA